MVYATSVVCMFTVARAARHMSGRARAMRGRAVLMGGEAAGATRVREPNGGERAQAAAQWQPSATARRGRHATARTEYSNIHGFIAA